MAATSAFRGAVITLALMMPIEFGWAQAGAHGDLRTTGELEYSVQGSGEPVLFIHGSHIEDALVPIMNEPSLNKYKRIHYHRRGYAGSDPHDGSFSFEQEAADALALLHHLKIERAHIVGYSLGGIVAVELARSSPEAVQSLILIEPSLRLPGTAERGMPSFLANAIALHEAGESEAAVDSFWQTVSGPEWQSAAGRTLPEAVEQAVQNAAVFFELEAKHVLTYPFDTDISEELHHPIFYVRTPRASHARRVEFFQTWLPQTEEFVVADADHALPMQKPGIIAEAITGFIRRHAASKGMQNPENFRNGQFTTSDGVELRYVEAGSGRTLIFVPGWSMPAWIWQAQIDHFAATHRVVAVDPRV